MRLDHFSVVAVGVGLCNAERARELQLLGVRREKIQNVSSITYSLASTTSPSFSFSLLGTAASSRLHTLPLTGHRTSGNSSRPYATGAVHSTGTAPSPHQSSNGSCGQPTVNVLGASLDWWYTSTIYNAVSTFSIQFNTDDTATGWTLLPATTPFDLGSALGDATPVAAKTTIVTQTAYSSPNATTGKGQIPNVIVTPPPASITIPNYPTTFSSESETAFIHFNSYEVISQTPLAYGTGPHLCATVTKTHTLSTPVAFPYTGPVANNSGASATGAVDSAVLKALGQSVAVAGSWKAAPTVAIVVQKVFAAEAVLAASVEVSEKSLLTPSATLPSFLSPVHPKTTKAQPPEGNPKGHTETTQSFLLVPTPVSTKTGGGGNDDSPPRTTADADPQGGGAHMVPFVAHLEHSEITLQVPTPGAAEVITTKVKGVVVTATRAPQGAKPNKPVSSAVITPAPALTIGTDVYHATSGSIYIIHGQTLTPGGVISVGGTFVSLAPGLSTVVINGKTKAIAGTATGNPAALITSPPILTIGGNTYPAVNSGPTYLINGKTLTPGDKETVIIHGSTYIVSLAPGATVLEIKTVGPNGKVTATMFERLYPGGSQATRTSIVGVDGASATSRHAKGGPAQSTGPAASLQNAATLRSVGTGAVACAIGLLGLAIWL